jgi:hypothetical protein
MSYGTAVCDNILSSGNLTVSGNLAPTGMILPTWTTATRPSISVTGQTAFNNTTHAPEIYNSTVSAWQPYGKILQVISNTITAPYATSSTTYAVPSGLSLTITPFSTSSKILLMCNLTTGFASGGSGLAYYFARGSTPICIGNSAAGQPSVTGGGYAGDFTYSNQASFISVGSQYIDSPATTSAVTYNIYVGASNTTTAYLNRTVSNRADTYYDVLSTSTFTIMEISG